jgi:hypothetical protein
MQLLQSAFSTMRSIVLPYEPGYVGHRVAAERRKKITEWLQQRERELDERHVRSVPARGSDLDKISDH